MEDRRCLARAIQGVAHLTLQRRLATPLLAAEDDIARSLPP